jgi:c-di-GMP-binding flagellar brake protein YcgR
MENDAVLEDVAVSNIGLGGLLICFAVGAQPTIKDQEVLSNIEVTLLPSGDAADTKQEETEVFYIEKGVCVRSFIDKAARKSCLGVEFKPKPAEEMKLMQFIRQLELNELRKGVAQQ